MIWRPEQTLLESMVQDLRARFGDQIQDITIVNGEITLLTEAGKLVGMLTALRDGEEMRFTELVDVCGVDYPHREKRFDLVYHLLSITNNRRLRIKVMLGEDEVAPSVSAVFPSAIWFEREAFDMYGIAFSDHPDLRRILTDYGFEGHPLRKDFPLTGHVELRYSEEHKRVVYEPVQLAQDFRTFDFSSPWEDVPSAGQSDQDDNAGSSGASS